MSMTRTPYMGLVPYAERDAPFFFGREKESRLVVANLHSAALTLFYGASGVGKSSVLRAGVTHMLRQREDLLVVVFNSWQGNPASDLMQAVADCADRTDHSAWAKAAHLLARQRPVSLTEFLTICAAQLNRRLMIILDQFEEYFLYHPQDDEFAAEFPKVVTQSDAPVSFLISTREDSLAKLDRFEGRIPRLFDNYLRIAHLDHDAARAAIEKPIAQYNRLNANDGQQFNIELELVEAVLTQIETGRVILGEGGRGVIEAAKSHEEAEAQIETPFLQLVMTRLWDEERRIGSDTLRLETLNRLGGAENIVRTHLDAVIAKLLPHEQEIAASIFHYLVTPSGTKIAYTASDLAGSAELNGPEVVRVLERLSHGDVRILRPVDSPVRAAPRYEIFHDVLAPGILDWRARYVQMRSREEAERVAEENRRRSDERARVEAQRQRVRVLRRAVTAMSLLLIVMGGLTVYAFRQRVGAKRAQAETFAQKAEAVRQRDIANQQSEIAANQAQELQKANVLLQDQKAQTEIERQRAIEQSRVAKAQETVAIGERMRALRYADTLKGLFRDSYVAQLNYQLAASDTRTPCDMKMQLQENLLQWERLRAGYVALGERAQTDSTSEIIDRIRRQVKNLVCP